MKREKTAAENVNVWRHPDAINDFALCVGGAGGRWASVMNSQRNMRIGLFSSELEIGLSLLKPGVNTIYELGLNCETTLKTLETK